MAKLVSIVIPIYNVESFLENCLNSIKNQSYKDIEVLLVDDGSKDNSREICDEFISIDNRFKYFCQKNLGVSAARNNGMKNAQGEYITFIDGDDYIDKDHIKKMVSNLSKSEIVISGRRNVTENGIEAVYQSDKDIAFDREKLIEQILKTGIVYSFPWNKIYELKIIRNNDIQFDEDLDYGEDLVFNIQYALLIRKGILVTGSTYNYVYRENSVSNQLDAATLKKRVTDLLAIKRVIKMLPSKFIAEKDFLNRRITVEGSKYVRLMSVYNFPNDSIELYKGMVINSYKLVKSSLSNREKLVCFGNLKLPGLMNMLLKFK